MSNTTKPNLSFSDVYRFTSQYWFRQPKKFIFILVFILIASFLETYLPQALSVFLNAIREHQPHNSILFYLGIFLATYVAQTLLFSIVYIVYNSFETNLFKDLVDDVYEHIYRLPEKFFANTFTGSIVSKINRARQRIEIFEDQLLLRIFPTVIVLIGTLFFLTLHFAALALIMLVYLIFLIIVSSVLVFKVSGPAQGIYADAQDSFSAHLADSISGMSPTKAYAKEAFEINRFGVITEDLRIKNLYAYQLGNLAVLIQRVLLAGMLAILMGGGTWYFFHGMANVENMAYLALAYNIIQSYIRDVGENIKNLLTASYDLHGVIELLHETPEVSQSKVLPDLKIKKGDILFDSVEFTYPDKVSPIFKNFSIHISAGERVALVGHSGGGKTSFIRLLQCLYPIQQGHIYIDGQDIYAGSRHSLRESIALVPQDPILFHRSLRENIAYARPEADFDDIKEAARKAHIEDFILNLPEQYETLVGERGIKLSGGERQRIAIARAILANRPILILDEATSSLDSESERAIQNALYTLTHGRTAIMIAHRLSTILDADRILVFEKGQIVEEGNHAELIKNENGIYARLFKLQSGGFITE